ncbi:MAG: hypothetical protein HY539_05210, partial [Deltaproteobacteria bacterium]|nr:hypothetical protein [Deltaproteobacteria bacterium]
MNRFRSVFFSSVSVIFLLFSVSPVEGKSFKKFQQEKRHHPVALKKLHLDPNSCWKKELKNRLKDLSLDPVESLVSDLRCSIDIQGENLLEKLCESYLSDDGLEAMSTTIRLAMGLRCLSQTEIVMLSKGIQGYMEALTEKGNCPQGLACMANVAILLNDMFPDQKKTPLRETFKRKKEALKEAITNYGNKDVGLWCSDHIGNLFQFQDQCDSKPKGKGFKKKGCIKPLSMMVEALGDDDRITSGECRCYEMIHNGYFCTGASKACPAIEEEKETSREPLGGREGFLMKRSKAVNTDLVAVPFDCMTNSRDLADAMEKLAPTGYCSARQMFGQIAPAVSRTVQNKNQLSCAKSGILEERLFGESEIFMNPGCAVLDGEGGGAGGEAEPEPESEEEEIKDACKNAANPPACEAARKAGMERLRNNKEMLRQQCQRLLGGSSPQCTPGAINTAI